METQERIKEIKAYLVELRQVAKKHYQNKKIRLYKTVCDKILENEKALSNLKKVNTRKSRAAIKIIRSNAKAY